MLDYQRIIDEHKENVQNIFSKFGVTADVNVENLQNAMQGVPSIRNAVLNTFQNFEGNKEGKDTDYEIEYDAVTGEEKKVKRKKILKDVFGFAKDAAQNYIKTKQGTETQTDVPTYDEKTGNGTVKKETKKVFGMPLPAFIGLCVIVFLIILALILKNKK